MPWGDGGRSVLLGMVRSVASMLRHDPDVIVASTALSTMCALDGLITPRAPALMIPSRESVSDSKNTLSARDIVEGITTAAAELATAAAKESKQRKKKKTDDETKKKSTPPKESAEDLLISPESAPVNNAIKAKTEPKLSAQPDAKHPANGNNNKTTEDTSEAIYDAMPMDLSNGEDLDNKTEHKQTVVTLTPALAVAKPAEKHEESDNDSCSLGDFPEIVDEDPDEEDRV
jgi:hypothetical protein